MKVVSNRFRFPDISLIVALSLPPLSLIPLTNVQLENKVLLIEGCCQKFDACMCARAGRTCWASSHVCRHKLDTDSSGDISYSELHGALATQSLYGIQRGRHYVTLSHLEAESCRIAQTTDLQHSTTGSTQALIPSPAATVDALRTGRAMLDQTSNFVLGSPYQTMIIRTYQYLIVLKESDPL